MREAGDRLPTVKGMLQLGIGLIFPLSVGIAPDFDQRIALDAQNIRVLHTGTQMRRSRAGAVG